MTIQQAYQHLLSQLYEISDQREAANIANMVIENITGFKKIDRIINKNFPLSIEQQERLQHHQQELLNHRPVQYVLGEAWFAGMKLFVDENVLIPRPETEELVQWITEEVSKRSSAASLKILDIGTGSGCIPIALKKKLSKAEVSAIDVSAGALTVAKRNAAEQETPVTFVQLNFLNEDEWNRLPVYDIIVSNPPYIKQSEETTMEKNVLDHEPHLALFVPDNEPLIFYKKIALFAQSHLQTNGIIFLEINEALGEDVRHLYEDAGFNEIEIKKDMQGKERMVKVMR